MACSGPRGTAEVGIFGALRAGDKGSSVPHTGSGLDATAREGQFGKEEVALKGELTKG